MARPRQPIALIEAKGRSHLGKAEIRERRSREIVPIVDNIVAPGFLTSSQKKKFNDIASQLLKLGVMGETDVDALARYIVAEDFYIHATRQLRRRDVQKDFQTMSVWIRIQEKFFKQCRACANDLGLTISSRGRLVVPEIEEVESRENKFTRFIK